MKSYSKTGALLLLGLLFSGCGTMQAKKDGEPSVLTAAQQKQADEQAALVKQEYEQALVTMRQGNYPLAIKQFTTFSESHPDFAGPYVNVGILYFKMRDLAQAEKALSRAVELNPKHAVAQNQLGMIYRELGRFDDAVVAYRRAIAANEEYAEAYLNLGILYDLYLFDAKKALQLYTQYQSMTKNQDAQVSLWITELMQRTQHLSSADDGE